jgi:ribosomal protein L24
MALYGDALIAIWDGTSKGTRGMIDIAKRKGLRIYVKMVNGINKIPQSLMSPPNCRFVFGSNDKGIHGKGAALDAKTFYGAAKFHGRGFTGKCYAIATKDKDFVRHRIEDVSAQIRHLITVEGVTEENKKLKFLVTRVGCGYAGFTDEQMAPLWANSPENFYFPPEWKKFGYKSWADIQ